MRSASLGYQARIAGDQADLMHVDVEQRCRDLCESRLVALTRRLGAGDDFDGPLWLNGQDNPLPLGTDRRLDVICNADTAHHISRCAFGATLFESNPIG